MFRFPVLLALAVIFMPSTAHALNEGLQCVPYARALTGVQIRGDAHTWWGQAKGRYERGSRPKVGAVMSFKSHGASRLGHIAAVRKIIDKRTVLVSHANWSRINGKRGHIEENVKVVDSSAKNDWSRVRVWYTPNNALGGTSRPLNGFIYPKSRRSDSQARAALVKLIGPKARVSPVKGYGGGSKAVRVATVKKAKPRYGPNPGSFTLSSAALSDVNRKAAKETAAPKRQQMPARVNSIDDLLIGLGG